MKFLTKIFSYIRSTFLSIDMLYTVAFFYSLFILKSIQHNLPYWSALFLVVGALILFIGLCTLLFITILPNGSKKEIVDTFHQWLITVIVFYFLRELIPGDPIWLMVTLWIVSVGFLFTAWLAWDIYRIASRRSRCPTPSD
jgi:hypothetical protein